MQRDMELIRKIVLALDAPEVTGPLNGLEGVEKLAFAYQAQLLIEAGLAIGTVGGSIKGIPGVAQLFRLTWAGHDFATSIQEDTLWNKAKEHVLQPTAAWSFGILLAYLKAEMARKIPGLDQVL